LSFPRRACPSEGRGENPVKWQNPNFYETIDPGARNFTIGQSADQLVIRLRTTKTSLNGTNPHLIIDDSFNYPSLQHVVVTYDFSEQRVYINGEQRARSKVLKGDFSNWDPACRLVVGNEVTGRRPWKRKIYYAAIFNSPMTKKEICRNYLLGMRSKINNEKLENGGFKSKIPVARYLFSERKGDTIHDSGSDLSSVNLLIPKYIWRGTKPFLYFSKNYIKSSSLKNDGAPKA